MVVVNCRAGQRSNRLVIAAHAMATAIARRETLLLTTFDEYKNDYVCMTDSSIRIVIGRSRFWEWVRLAERLMQIAFGFKCFSIPHVLTLASSWTYRAPAELSCHEDVVRHFFAPVDVCRAQEELRGIKQEGMSLVGVHIRRRDYKTFLCGRYFFGDEVYRRAMMSAYSSLKKDGRDVLFLVFSDDVVDESAYKGLPCRFIHGSPVEDQWMMSRCDYLMGPPSTFSAWASFMGKVPLARIWSENHVLKNGDFVYRGLVA